MNTPSHCCPADDLADLPVAKLACVVLTDAGVVPELWLGTPHQLLGMRTPSQLLAEGDDSSDRVRNLLLAISEGAFT